MDDKKRKYIKKEFLKKIKEEKDNERKIDLIVAYGIFRAFDELFNK